jgi:hypothetical protein
MLLQFLVLIILYILINQIILSYKQEIDSKTAEPLPTNNIKINKINTNIINTKDNTNENTTVTEIVPQNLFGKPDIVVPNEYILWRFIKPNPWTQIIYMYNQEFPLKFYFKVTIPSLNDYQAWKQVIPNLEFDAKIGELIISSKDEESALAIANLIVSNFTGQLSFENILEKNLIPISISKAQQYEMVKNKLRENIAEALNGKNMLNTNNKRDFEEDLASLPSASTKIKETISDIVKESFNNFGYSGYENGDDFSYIN